VHAVEVAEATLGGSFDVVVDLDATSPLRLPDDVVAAVALLEHDPDAVNVITAAPADAPPTSTSSSAVLTGSCSSRGRRTRRCCVGRTHPSAST
jgi:CMP-N-acetylneuraminic acid synthetase